MGRSIIFTFGRYYYIDQIKIYEIGRACRIHGYVSSLAQYTWSRELRRMFGPKKVKVEGEWRRLHNEELHQILLR
jgi:hypothetical protein